MKAKACTNQSSGKTWTFGFHRVPLVSMCFVEQKASSLGPRFCREKMVTISMKIETNMLRFFHLAKNFECSPQATNSQTPKPNPPCPTPQHCPQIPRHLWTSRNQKGLEPRTPRRHCPGMLRWRLPWHFPRPLRHCGIGDPQS